ncbi:hypothetical protein BD769DRAFT_1432309 [Suillus cothurnatus]|nr:hypothetical protein BD769DRAFT_1432309 [Suillus cothurnatus]
MFYRLLNCLLAPSTFSVALPSPLVIVSNIDDRIECVLVISLIPGSCHSRTHRRSPTTHWQALPRSSSSTLF